MRVTSRYKNSNGGGRIQVRGGGHQLTVGYDHAARDPHLAAVRAFITRYDVPSTAVTEVETYPSVRYWEITTQEVRK